MHGLSWHLSQVQAVHQNRLWSRILQYFVALPIEADVPTQPRPYGGPNDIRGISTIAGLPLPNSGQYVGEYGPIEYLYGSGPELFVLVKDKPVHVCSLPGNLTYDAAHPAFFCFSTRPS